MVKAFLFGFLSACIICGILWFVVGRLQIADIRGAVDRADGDLERSELLVDQFGDNLGRYTDQFSVSVEEAGQLRDSIGGLRTEFSGYAPEVGDIKHELVTISDGITSVKEGVQRIIIINRDFADILYEHRRISEASGE